MNLPAKFDFSDLFIFEMANNHQGNVDHGVSIIREMGAIAKEFGIKAGVKLQLRDLDTFIHPSYKDRKDVKHIPRFISTRLSAEEFRRLVDEIHHQGMLSIATPFDEPSVDVLRDLGVAIIKVASCSSHDWPLLDLIAHTGKPVIVSVGGRSIEEIDRVVSFFDHRGTHYALMHCVSIYPTPHTKLNLNQIETFKNRYPHLTIGFSTHEEPTNTTAIALAYAKGARIFEKHVGIPTATITLNAYSANPAQVREWVRAYSGAVESCGEVRVGRAVDPGEREDLHTLTRGVFAKETVLTGTPLSREHVFFAMPLISKQQLTSGQFKEGMIANRDYLSGEALDGSLTEQSAAKKDVIYSSIHAVKGMLNMARVSLSHDFAVELSHHYSLERFPEVGCTIIECFNREYAKKLIVQLPGQWNPHHYHKKKDETFQVLWGQLEVDINGRKRTLHPGDTLWVPRGVPHAFWTNAGVVFEEISTTNVADDSYYSDQVIAHTPRESRKTRLHNWGMHQFD